MNIAFVFPPFYFEPMYNMPPLGLINLATIVNNGSRRLKIFDFPLTIRMKTIPMDRDIYMRCAREILDFEPEMAAFSVQCTTYPPSVGIAEEIKKLKPGVKIVFGGHNASFADEATLARFPFVDAIVRGEGEVSFPELVRAYEEQTPLDRVEGITFRSNGRVVRNPDRPLIEDLDSLPPGDYGFVAPLSVYREACGTKRSIAILEVGRGCPHRCVYCSQSLIWRRRTRTFSTDRLIREMKELSGKFGAECFLLAYDQFTARREFAEQFCHGVIDAGLNGIPWYCISRLDTMDEPLLNLMREAGCESMCYGIDSGSSRTLAFIRKNIDHEVLFERVRETTEAGMVPTLSFVIGFPEETGEDIDATLRLALKSAASGNTNILVQLATVLPGTELWEKYRGALIREVDTYFSLGIEFDEGRRIASDEALIDSEPEIFSSFYNLPCPAAPLRKLDELASYFTLVADLYPRSFLVLSLELNRSVLALFFRFLDRVFGPGEDTAGRNLTPEDCLANFAHFAAETLGDNHLVRDYFFELVKYETCLIRSAGAEAPDAGAAFDSRADAGPPRPRREKILTEKFTFDIPSVTLDMKFGRYPDSCPRRPVFLVFSHSNGVARVREVNEFGYDFLLLCDGRQTFEQIVSELYPKYGVDTERDRFASSCVEAAGVLVDLELIAPFASPQSGIEGR